MNLENLMLSKGHRRTNILWFYLSEVPRIGKFTETESRMVVTQGAEEGRMGNYCLMDTEFCLRS